MRGCFITFEGGEGAGKSTQGALLRDALTARGHDVVLTREPGGSPGAEDIRTLLVRGEPERWTPLTETLLFLAARSDHVARLIEPALARGAWVICDRYADSTLVYQGVARGLGLDNVRALMDAVPNIPQPDLTLVLDLPPELGLTRAHGRNTAETRFEKFDGGFHAQLRQSFQAIAAAEPRRCAVIEAAKTPDQVAADVWAVVLDRLAP